MTMTKTEMKDLLSNNVCSVSFVKKDGTIRNMVCTLQESVIKPYIEELNEKKSEQIKNGKTVVSRPENPDVISVIDTEKNAWRAFNVSSVKEFKVL